MGAEARIVYQSASNELNLARSDLEYSEPGLTNVNYVLGSVITGEMVEDPGGAG